MGSLLNYFLKYKQNHRQIFKPHSLALFFLASLLFGLWLYYANMEVLGPPDFYKYYNQSQRMFQLDFENSLIPPLFPFLLGLFSKILHLFSPSETIPLWVGRSLNLAATLGCLFFLNRLARHFFTIGRSFFLWAFCLSPLFLCFHSTPLTEMIFLCFFLGFVDALSREDASRVVLYALLAAATRIEGMLLLIIATAYLLSSPKLRRFRSRLFVLLALGLPGLFVLTAILLPERIQFLITHLTDFSSFSHFISHPSHLKNLIYANIFFFLPAPPPLHVQLISLSCFGLIFAFGLKTLARKSTFMTWSILFFLFTFFLSKGYLASLDPYAPNTRRVLYAITLIILVAFWGLQSLYSKAKHKGQLPLFITAGVLFSFFLILHIPNLSTWMNPWPILAVLPLLADLPDRLKRHPIDFFGLTLRVCLTILIGLLLSFSFWMGSDYLNSSPNKGAFAIAQYINRNPDKAPFLLCTESSTLEYYLKTDPIREWFSSGDLSETLFLNNLKQVVDNKQIRHFAFDFYLSFPGDTVTIDKTHLMKLAGNKELFLPRTLRYKEQIVAYLLIPRFRSSPILSPEANEVWMKGDRRTIRWNANALSGDLMLELMQQDEPAGIIARRVPAINGSFDWVVGRLEDGRYASGDRMSIRSRPALPPIVLTSPADGDQWRLNEIRTITWTCQDLTGPARIELLQNDTRIGIIRSEIPIESGQYTWVVGELESGVTKPNDKMRIAIRRIQAN